MSSVFPEVWAAPLVLRYKSTDSGDLARLRPGQSIGALFHAEGNRALLSSLAASKATAYSYEFLEEDGRFPLAAPGGEIAGIQAVLYGAQALQTIRDGRGVLLARVTGAVTPRVVVIGCGNVGSAAVRTAAALGAQVTVLARSEKPASRYLPGAPVGVRVAVNTPANRIDTGHLDRADRVSGFERLLQWAAARSNLRYEFRPYSVYQGLPPVRTCLHALAFRLEDFRSIVAPADGIVRIRPRCPECRLMEKSAKNLTITAGDGEVHLDSRCPIHGRYRETIDITGTDGWYDANTPVRSIQKGFLLSAERKLYQACSVSIDGADWGGAWYAHVLAPALATLGIPAAEWPVSVFTPLVLDRSGGKLSKTLYVRYGPAYADLPEAFLNLDILLDHHGDDALEAIWTEVTRWAAEPRRLHRAYTVDHLAGIIRTPANDPALRTCTA